MTHEADDLRTALVHSLRGKGIIRTDRVAAAFAAVPRHLFTPDASLDDAYADAIVATKRDDDGVVISSVSAPNIIALMLEQAEIEPDMRVLEIGSGGYNASLISELVGPGGEVTTIDIDQDVVDRARDCLAAAGYTNVNVEQGDGEFGVARYAPYDRIIVTAGAWDIPPAWTEQLALGGRIIVPVRISGLTRSVVFERDGDRLVSRSVELCGFVRMQGASERKEDLVLLHGEDVGLRVDDKPFDRDALRAAMSEPPTTVWSGVTVGSQEPFDGLDLWLATALPGFCRLHVQRPAIEAKVVTPALPWGASAVFDGGSFAYLTLRPASEDDTFEFGAIGHGPDGEKLATQVAAQVCAWNSGYRYGSTPHISAYPVGTADEQLPDGLVVDKKHVRITVSWS
ncbi:hypothetical protein GCM10010124_02520 [Pilimelia terevasa]|uniref:Protein-L-isoaspartate O-methyltransferase n=1 Tax=Pilimelia terevasa TaxID=53372 RepID=A0A8J3BIU1_9ACTN|nr:methyltransferase, FxLD system [Pilimelia terevasa]GGK13450.1 hypothetical protein GCM10010124_02520 [Pilimelia terevasa]